MIMIEECLEVFIQDQRNIPGLVYNVMLNVQYVLYILFSVPHPNTIVGSNDKVIHRRISWNLLSMKT